MTLIPLVNLQDGEKLEALRRLDSHREWYSLDEKRYCIVCGSVVTGREIQIVEGTRETGGLLAACPTPGCRSIPMDWVRPTDEVLASQFAGSANASASPPRSDQAA